MLVLCVSILNKSKGLICKMHIDYLISMIFSAKYFSFITPIQNEKTIILKHLFSDISFNLSLLYRYVYGIMKFNLSMKWFYKLWGLLFWKYSSALKHKWLLIFETSSPKCIKTMPAYKRIRSKSNYHSRWCTLIDGCFLVLSNRNLMVIYTNTLMQI